MYVSVLMKQNSSGLQAWEWARMQFGNLRPAKNASFKKSKKITLLFEKDFDSGFWK